MRIYTPSKSTPTLQSVLKELYCLKQSIKHDLGKPDDHLKMLDNISALVRQALSGE